MGLFGKSFDEKVQEALETIRGMGFDVTGLDATVDGKNVTLVGTVASRTTKFEIMERFNELVETDNTLNTIRIEAPSEAVTEVVPPPPVSAEARTEQIYEVVSGDTLGAIAKRFYGKAGLYPKIFEANRDILDNPNVIKVGQKLRIPVAEE